MTARDDAVEAMGQAYMDIEYGGWLPDDMGRLLDAIPADVLVRVANERRLITPTAETDR